VYNSPIKSKTFYVLLFNLFFFLQSYYLLSYTLHSVRIVDLVVVLWTRMTF